MRCESVTLLSTNRLKKMFTSSALLKPVPKRLVRYAELFAPILKALGFAHELDERSRSPVSDLLCFCGPSTVIWRVAFAVVNSVKCHRWWSRTHVFVEHLKVGPSFAYTNSSTAVIRISRVGRRKASPSHLNPNPVLRAACHPVAKICGLIFLQAPARFCSSVHHGVSKSLNFNAATAPEEPASLSISRLVFNTPNCGESVEGFSSEVKWLHSTFIVNDARQIKTMHNRRQFERDWCLRGLA
jgi:hypothetical protein